VLRETARGNRLQKGGGRPSENHQERKYLIKGVLRGASLLLSGGGRLLQREAFSASRREGASGGLLDRKGIQILCGERPYYRGEEASRGNFIGGLGWGPEKVRRGG